VTRSPALDAVGRVDCAESPSSWSLERICPPAGEPCGWLRAGGEELGRCTASLAKAARSRACCLAIVLEACPSPGSGADGADGRRVGWRWSEKKPATSSGGRRGVRVGGHWGVRVGWRWSDRKPSGVWGAKEPSRQQSSSCGQREAPASTAAPAPARSTAAAHGVVACARVGRPFKSCRIPRRGCTGSLGDGSP
jgi:hypothetical protein